MSITSTLVQGRGGEREKGVKRVERVEKERRAFAGSLGIPENGNVFNLSKLGKHESHVVFTEVSR
jgi:hypothetical protein